MAVGIVIGATFSTIVKSLVDDIVMPPVGELTDGSISPIWSFLSTVPMTIGLLAREVPLLEEICDALIARK